MGNNNKFKPKSEREKLKDQYKINEDIRPGKIILIDTTYNTNREIELREALQIAQTRELDLVQIAFNKIPVVKLIKYDKFIYQQQKQQKNNVQHAKKDKMIKLSPNIFENDLEHKINHIIEFIEKGHRVELYLRFAGREIEHKEIGRKIFDKIIDQTSMVAKIETELKDNGNNLTMTLSKK